jgi:hypothetical protein
MPLWASCRRRTEIQSEVVARISRPPRLVVFSKGSFRGRPETWGMYDYPYGSSAVALVAA